MFRFTGKRSTNSGTSLSKSSDNCLFVKKEKKNKNQKASQVFCLKLELKFGFRNQQQKFRIVFDRKEQKQFSSPQFKKTINHRQQEQLLYYGMIWIGQTGNGNKV